MRSTLHRAAAFVMYQFSLLVGIALFPMAVLMGRIGIFLPFHRVVSRTEEIYDRATSKSA